MDEILSQWVNCYRHGVWVRAKLLQLCPALCDFMNHSLLGSSVHGILQARILEWVAMLFSRGSFWPRDPTCVPYISCIGGGLVTKSCPTLATPWTVACQASLSMGSSRQEYWSGFPFPSTGDLPEPGTEPGSPVLQADSLPSEPPGKPVSSIIKLQF